MTQPVFRFAPSPNGHLHLGHALSALLNAEMARAAGGRLLLRIEDIDATRCRPEYEAAILEDLAWLGHRLGTAGAAPVRALRRLRPGAGEARRAGPHLSELREPRRDRAAGRRARCEGAVAARSGRRAALSRRCEDAESPTSAPRGWRERALRAAPRHERGGRAQRRAHLGRDRRKSEGRARHPDGAAGGLGRRRARRARRRRRAIISRSWSTTRCRA